METEFWQKAWAKSAEPGWQQKSANSLLVAHWAACKAVPGESVFVPLCGRSPDINWLLNFGHKVIGIDLSRSALQRFCDESGLDVKPEEHNGFTVFKAPQLTLYAGDFFSSTPDMFSGISRVYDRASIVAMPPNMRERYVSHLRSVVPSQAEMFTIAMAYDQSKMQGPPFSVEETELRKFFADRYDISVLGSEHGDMRNRGLESLEETAYRLLPNVVNET